MAEFTGIEWTDHTMNPWWGCQAVSPACDHCYAEALDKRTGGTHFGPGAERRRTKLPNWKAPLRWNKAAGDARVRRRVFCASMADVFDNAVDPAWRADLWDLIRVTENLDWQLLTKRPQNIAKMLPGDWGDGWPQVWLGTTVENQAEAQRRIPHLQNVPAAIRFLSCEPLLEEISLHRWLPGIDWVICGGESGHGARPLSLAAARSLRDQCETHDVAFFFKQYGDYAPATARRDATHAMRLSDGWLHDLRQRPWTPGRFAEAGARWDLFTRMGKKAAGNLLDGRHHKEFPR